MGLETAAIIGLATAAASGTAGVVGAKLSSNAARDAAKTQTDAANRAAEIQAQSQREALAFQQQQAAEDARRFETTQRSNYDQWAARQGYQSTVGSMLGLPSRNIPAYVSSLPGGTPQGLPSAGSGGDPRAAAFIADWQAKHQPSEGIAPLAAALQQAGLSTGRFMYGQTPSNNEVSIGGQKYKVGVDDGRGGLASWYAAGTDDSAPGAAPSPGYGGGYVAPMSALLQPRQTTSTRLLTPALRLPGGY